MIHRDFRKVTHYRLSGLVFMKIGNLLNWLESVECTKFPAQMLAG